MTDEFKGTLAACFSMFAWAGWIIISKFGVEQNLTPWDIIFIRFLVASSISIIIVIRYFKVFKNIFSYKVIISSLAYGLIYLSASLLGFLNSNAANAGVIVNGLMPVICATMLYVWKGQKLNKYKYLSIFIVLFANILLLINADGITAKGFFWFLLASTSTSFFTVSIGVWEIPPKYFAAMASIINFVIFLPIWLFITPSNIANASVFEITLQGVYQGIIISLLSLSLVTYSIRTIGAIKLTIINSFVPSIAAILSVLILSEEMSLKSIISVILCTIGILSFAIFSMRTDKKVS